MATQSAQTVGQLTDAATKQGRSPGWENIWAGGLAPGAAFDKGEPLPELARSVDDPRLFPKNASVLIPGGGRGYEAAFLASRGYRAVNLELAPTATVRARERYESAECSQERELAAQAGGSAEFVTGDYFTYGGDAVFDVVFDQTFFCALPPEMRDAIARRHFENLKPGGLLYSVVFPINTHQGGPPYALNEAMVKNHLVAAGFAIESFRMLGPGEAHPGRHGPPPTSETGLLLSRKPRAG